MMNKKIVIGLAITAAVGTLLMGQFSSNTDPKSTDVSQKSQDAYAFTLTDMGGESLALEDYKDHVVILNFWATWCGPCMLEIPSFIALTDTYKDQKVVIIGLSVDESEAEVRAMMRDKKINYPIAMATEKVQKEYGGIYAIPTTFILNKNHQIVDKTMGYQTESYFIERIEELLK